MLRILRKLNGTTFTFGVKSFPNAQTLTQNILKVQYHDEVFLDASTSSR